MQEREGQRTHQERGHAPEGPEEIGVAVAIVVRRVGQVAGKLPVRPFVTLATGFDDIVPAQGRGGVGRRQGAVRTVAVITLGDTLAAES